ncbi:MAG TPA: YjgP/YjgQ family permease [Treponema sp.]|nr:YjgP/YjgQ family permease [Treponema sp.]
MDNGLLPEADMQGRLAAKKTIVLSLRNAAEKVISFSFHRSFLLLCLNHYRKTNNYEKARLYEEKLADYDYIKTDVLTKYFSKELFIYFFICFLFFFVVFFVNQILLMAETILRMRVPVGSVLRLIVYCLPGVIAQSSPFATLVGFLMCLGRMVTDNEILILRASGQRYAVILKPVIVIGLLISVFSFVMNDYFLPLGTLNYNKMRRQIVASNPAVELESNSIKKMNNSVFVIGDVEGTSVSDLVLFDSSSGSQRLIISGESNVKKSSDKGVIMSMDLNDSLVYLLDRQHPKNYDVIEAETMHLNVFEDTVIEYTGDIAPHEMTSYDLAKKIRDMKGQEGISHKKMNRYKLEFNKKFSVPFGSIFFALLAFPLALVFGKKDGQTLGLIFGIIISVLYWSATIIGQMFGLRGGYSGFWMMWTPNFVIGFFGIRLYLRLRRK